MLIRHFIFDKNTSFLKKSNKKNIVMLWVLYFKLNYASALHKYLGGSGLKPWLLSSMFEVDIEACKYPHFVNILFNYA